MVWHGMVYCDHICSDVIVNCTTDPSSELSQVQIREGCEGDEGGLDFHFDKDEALMKTQDIWYNIHPPYPPAPCTLHDYDTII